VITLKPNQSRIFLDDSRFIVSICGRRFGKTTTLAVKLVKKALEKKGLYAYCAPTYRQAKLIAWDIFKSTIPKKLKKKTNESELSITLLNGSTIRLFGLDRAESLLGVKLAGALLDEYDQTKLGVYEQVIRPALSDSLGFCWFIGSPDSTKRRLKELYDDVRTKRLDGWSAYHFTSLDGGYIPESEIETAKRELDPRNFREQYEASFEDVHGQVYYGFSPDHNIRDDIAYLPNLPIRLCFDFNVNPFCIVVCQEYERETDDPLRRKERIVHALDEIRLENSNTAEACKAFLDRYGSHKGGVIVYGDSTGNSRHTSSSLSDYQIIIDHLKNMPRFTVRIKSANPPVKDRINAVNAMLCNYLGERRLFLNRKKTQWLQKDLMNVIYKKGTTEIDKTYDLSLTHMSDAMGYYIENEFSVHRGFFK
jgi:hypothetical protein